MLTYIIMWSVAAAWALLLNYGGSTTMEEKFGLMEQDFEWVQAIIQSGNNDFHFEVIDNLIMLFISKYPEATKAETQLIADRWKTWNSIHGILK